MRLLAAIRFLTNIPIPWKKEDWAGEKALKAYAGSTVFYPLVGLLIGLILAGSYWLFNLFMPPLITAPLVVMMMVLISGGIHLDGLADTFDGVAAAHKSKGRGKEVMRQPDIGAIGVIALVLLLLMKVTAVASIDEHIIYTALIITPVLGRWAMIYAIYFYPYARAKGMGGEIKKVLCRKCFITTTLAMLVICLLVIGWIGFTLIAATVLLVVVLSVYLKGKFGGLTGDNYGTICEFSEALILIMMAIFSYNVWL